MYNCSISIACSRTVGSNPASRNSGVPRRSPIQVLTGRDAAWPNKLQWSQQQRLKPRICSLNWPFYARHELFTYCHWFLSRTFTHKYTHEQHIIATSSPIVSVTSRWSVSPSNVRTDVVIKQNSHRAADRAPVYGRRQPSALLTNWAVWHSRPTDQSRCFWVTLWTEQRHRSHHVTHTPVAHRQRRQPSIMPLASRRSVSQTWRHTRHTYDAILVCFKGMGWMRTWIGNYQLISKR